MERINWMLRLVMAAGLLASPMVASGQGDATKAEGPAKSADLKKLIVAAAKPVTPVSGEGWKPLFDGKSLAGWKVTNFRGHGAVHEQSGMLVMERGTALTGVTWTNEALKVNYEIALEAMRVEGSDFFCGLTFPAGDSYCSLILGGWGGQITGISSINGDDASDNMTTKVINFDAERWYRVKVRVAGARIEAWLDDEKIVDLDTEGLKITIRYGDIEMSEPLGIATWKTTGAVREIKMRQIEPPVSRKK